jgi:hypothetical protein
LDKVPPKNNRCKFICVLWTIILDFEVF